MDPAWAVGPACEPCCAEPCCSTAACCMACAWNCMAWACSCLACSCHCRASAIRSETGPPPAGSSDFRLNRPMTPPDVLNSARSSMHRPRPGCQAPGRPFCSDPCGAWQRAGSARCGLCQRHGEPLTMTDRRGTMTNAIEASGLVKRFGKTTALAGVDLVARQGTVLGVLGPNGAGKTTAVRILATLLRADDGRAQVCGYDVARQAHQVRQLIGLTGQYASVDEGLSGTNNLIMIGRLLGQSRRQSRARAGELLDRFDLSE